MRVEIVLEPLLDLKGCCALQTPPGGGERQPCLAPAKWAGFFRRGTLEARWTTCDAHLFPVAQFTLQRALSEARLQDLVVDQAVGQRQ